MPGLRLSVLTGSAEEQEPIGWSGSNPVDHDQERQAPWQESNYNPA